MFDENSGVLPSITSFHLHRSFGEFTRGPIPGKGGPKLTEAISALNDENYDTGFKLWTEALAAGLEGIYQSHV